MNYPLHINVARTGAQPPLTRFVLADEQGRYQVVPNARACWTQPGYAEWSYLDSSVSLPLPQGRYTWTATAGPAFTQAYGRVVVGSGRRAAIDIDLRRLLDPVEEGWVSADAHLHSYGRILERPALLEAMCRGEQLDYAGMQCWALYSDEKWTSEPPASPFFPAGKTILSCDQEIEMHSPWRDWEDTALVALQAPIADLRRGSGYLMNADFFAAARRQGVGLIVYQGPMWAQLPVDIALGFVDSVSLCDNYFSVARPMTGPWSYSGLEPSDPDQQHPFGMACWVYRLFGNLLNAGAKLAVSGGSAFPNGGGGGPPGMNRFYVKTSFEDGVHGYLDAWRSGQTFATNGPLLFSRVQGRHPSQREIAVRGDRLELELRVVAACTPTCVQWIADGQVVAEHGGETRADGTCDFVWQTTIPASGIRWLAARAFGPGLRSMAGAAGHIAPPFQTAHTSPFYLAGFGDKRPDHRRTQAISGILDHLDWMRAVALDPTKAPDVSGWKQTLDPVSRRRVLHHLNRARHLWTQRLPEEV